MEAREVVRYGAVRCSTFGAAGAMAGFVADPPGTPFSPTWIDRRLRVALREATRRRLQITMGRLADGRRAAVASLDGLVHYALELPALPDDGTIPYKVQSFDLPVFSKEEAKCWLDWLFAGVAWEDVLEELAAEEILPAQRNDVP